jgi:hypothetical protein
LSRLVSDPSTATAARQLCLAWSRHTGPCRRAKAIARRSRAATSTCARLVLRTSRRLPGRRQLRAEQVDLCVPKSPLLDTWLRRSTPQANPLRAQSAWNLSAPSGGALKLGSGVLPKTYARPGLDVRRLGELVDLISGIGRGAAEHREKDIVGGVYEYFLGRFASAEGMGGGETRRSGSTRAVRTATTTLTASGGCAGMRRLGKGKPPEGGQGGEQGAPDVEDPGTRRARSRVLGRCPEGTCPCPGSRSGCSGVAAAQPPGGQAGQHDRVAAQHREPGPRA